MTGHAGIAGAFAVADEYGLHGFPFIAGERYPSDIQKIAKQ
ncbi:hypothetical protein [Rhizorhabdus histidinilytica]